MPIANEESLITYPTDFPIKVMGRKEGRFAHGVLAIVRKHAPDFDAATMELRPSRQGTYLSVTCTIRATSREQLDALYQDLCDHPSVVMVLQVELALAPRLRNYGLVEYLPLAAKMREFTMNRTPETPDEIWVLEHPPVYTLGQGADPKFGPKSANGIPVVQAERGGEITYHGPGQAVVYTLVDLSRRDIKVKEFVNLLEQCVINFLSGHEVQAERKPGAPGVYVGGAKIAQLGIRVTRGRAWHGLSLNVDMDLTPFNAIDPCGYPGLNVTQAKQFGVKGSAKEIGMRLGRILVHRLEHA